MSQKTSIEWTDRSWNPVRGCSRISPGCVNCYAEGIAARFSKPGLAYEGLAKRVGGEPRWTGKVRLVPDALTEPLSWRAPSRIFVNSMSDLFHEALSDEEIARVFAVMYLAPRHTFQVLTKRAARMQRTLTSKTFYQQVLDAARGLRDARPELTGVAISDPTKFPHRNVWLGVSVEDQEHADQRIPLLLATPAAVRFLSCEPLLGPVNLSPTRCPNRCHLRFGRDEQGAHCGHCGSELGDDAWLDPDGIDWAIVGGESGRNARPFDVAWARSIVKQCADADVPCFVKQLGAVPVMDSTEWNELFRASMATEWGPLLNARNRQRAPAGTEPLFFKSAKAGDPLEWPEDLRVRQFPEVRGV